MKLQKHLSRKAKGKTYFKWVVVLPSKKIEKLGWEEGEELRAEASKGNLIIKKSE